MSLIEKLKIDLVNCSTWRNVSEIMESEQEGEENCKGK